MKHAITAVAFSIFLAGCGQEQPNAPRPDVTVNSQTLAAPMELSERRFTGQVTVAEMTALAFRANGQIRERLVNAGDKVTKGQLLAKLDDVNAKQALTEAQARHQLLSRNLARSQKLLSQGMLAQAEFDELRANVRLAKVSVDTAQAALRYTELRAPFDGVIDQLQKQAFEFVGVGETVLSMYRNDRTDVVLKLADSLLMQAHNLAQHPSYRPQVSIGNDQPSYPMAFHEQAMLLDPSVGAYQTRLVSNEPLPLLPGQAVTIRMDLTQAGLPAVQGYEVPITAVQSMGANNGYRIWRIEDNQAQPVNIQISRINNQGVLISGDLQQGDQIITSQLSRLRPNMPVRQAQSEALSQ